MSSAERAFLDDLMLWSDPRSAPDDRARFHYLSNGGSHSLLLRDIQRDIADDGTGDWIVTYTSPSRPELSYAARSDTSTGAVLTLFARMCGLDGEIRGILPDEEDDNEAKGK